MAGLYIPDFEMPEIGPTDYIELHLFGNRSGVYYQKGERMHKSCILIPNHGDLIDRDTVWQGMVQTESFQEAQNALWNAPVVIPSNKNSK